MEIFLSRMRQNLATGISKLYKYMIWIFLKIQIRDWEFETGALEIGESGVLLCSFTFTIDLQPWTLDPL